MLSSLKAGASSNFQDLIFEVMAIHLNSIKTRSHSFGFLLTWAFWVMRMVDKPVIQAVIKVNTQIKLSNL